MNGSNVNGECKRWFGMLPLFDPEEGTTVLEPPGASPGFWVGGGSIIFDDDLGKFYLYYRLRNPRKSGDPKERGFECRIAESGDGVRFNDIWSVTKDAFNSVSIERAALVKTPGGKYRLYISFEDLGIGRWKIDMMEANSPDEFDPSKRIPIFAPIDNVVAHVKDPYVMIVGGLYYMFICYHPIRWQSSNTGLALSGDGVNFVWQGDVFEHGKGWDIGIGRINSIIYIPPVFYAFYDGGETMRSSCEEHSSIAISFDLRSFYRVSESGPLLTSPHGTKSLRYIDALKVGDEIYFYYEYTRLDGSHELRMNKVRWR
ncbi:MAG: hypothetical protein ACUVXI_19645 [bacterium]